MRSGGILVADHQGTFVIKLVGDVRVTLCVAFDDFVEKMLASKNFNSVLIDLSEAEGIDSTTLGLLAKVSIGAKKKFNYRPAILSTNESITRLIESMGFGYVFDVRTEAISSEDDLCALGSVECSEDGMRSKVIEAHRILMGLSDENRARFQELVTTLESTSL